MVVELQALKKNNQDQTISKMKKNKQNYIKNSWNLFVKSFKEFDTKVIFIVLYDLIFFSIVYISFITLAKLIQNKALNINAPQLEQLTQLQQTEIIQASSQLNNLWLYIYIGVILTLLIIFIAACIFKGMIWFKIAGKKANKKTIIKLIRTRALFLLISIGFIIAIIPLFISLSVAIKAQSLISVIILSTIIGLLWLIFINIKNLMYIYFTTTTNPIKKAFRIGIKKIHLLILPYIIMFIIFIIISQLYWLYNFMPGNISTIITVLILLVYLAWFRIYLYTIVKDIEKI